MALSTEETKSRLTSEINAIRKRVKEQKLAIDLEASKELSPLLERYNSCAAISRLPDEILLEVFKFTGDITLRQLLPVTRVCRRWRTLTIHSKTYWSTRSIGPCKPWHPEFHIRSGNAPISAEININTEKSLSNAVKALPPLTAHLRSVDMNVTKCATSSDYLASWKSLKKNLIQAASTVESLSLNIDSDAIIKPFLNSHKFPRLKTLELSPRSFIWKSSLFAPTVQHLTMRISDSTGYKLDSLYGALRNMKQLRTLDLSFVDHDLLGLWLTEEYITPNDDYDLEVELQHLQRFSLEGELPLVSRIIGDIEIGPETKLDIHCMFVPGRPRLSQSPNRQPLIPPGHEYRTLLHNISRNFEGFTSESDILRTVELRGTKIESYYHPVFKIRLTAYPRLVLPTRYGQYPPSRLSYRQQYFDSVNPIFVLESEEEKIRATNKAGQLAEKWDPVSRLMANFNPVSDANQEEYDKEMPVNLTVSPSRCTCDWSWSQGIFDSVEVLHLAGIRCMKNPYYLRPFKNIRILTLEGLSQSCYIISYLLTRPPKEDNPIRKPPSPLFPHLETIVCIETPTYTTGYRPRDPTDLRDALVNLYNNLSRLIVERSGMAATTVTDSMSVVIPPPTTNQDHDFNPLKEIFITRYFQAFGIAQSAYSYDETLNDLLKKLSTRLRDVGKKFGVNVVLEKEWQEK
ncbi:hypothetical protein C8Q75DRAFT_769720 [Abortiporus biennis]|nr:hypothetical protein C8Q75DRAFT_769720 [Abortiporus biennis]